MRTGSVSKAATKERLVTLACSAVVAGHVCAQELPLKDPMRPFSVERAIQSTSTAPRPRVSAILISPERRIAVIDDRHYREGDVFGGASIIRIESRAVYLRRGEQNFVMSLAEHASRSAE